MPARQATLPGEIDSLESILGLLKSLKIPWLNLTNRPVRRHRLAESIPVLLKRLQIRAPILHFCSQTFQHARRGGIRTHADINFPRITCSTVFVIIRIA